MKGRLKGAAYRGSSIVFGEYALKAVECGKNHDVKIHVRSSTNETNGTIIESNETNNNASRRITIPSYQLFYGEVVSDVFLDTSSNLTVFAWINSTNFNGSLYITDSDSNVDFTNLKALTRNLSNNFTFNDLGELDTSLDISNLTDSVNNSYASDNQLKDTYNFSVFGSLIEYVPIINSTNSSNFITGILWDTSDDAPGLGEGQYNGSEDVIFVTNIKKYSLGTYGVYDYEIRIPANLEKYLVPNEIDSVDLYREIT